MGYPFSLVLHTHLPMVVNHGRWPHGSDWLNEATFECYLPILEVIHRLVGDGISPKWTLNLSPILVEQLASPEFQKELAFYYENVRRACVDSRAHFVKEGRSDLVRLTEFWEEFYERMWELHRRIGGDIPGTFADLQRAGHLEIITCAATHGYLPLLSRDESIHMQLRTAVEAHTRHFGRAPRGIWLPECAYRPRYEWTPPTGRERGQDRRVRPGIEEMLAAHGLEYFIADSHLVAASKPETFAAIAPVSGGPPAPGDALAALLQKLKGTPALIVHGAQDGIAPAQLSRTMAAAAEKAGLRVSYVEVPDGDHVNVVASTFPAILDFFDKNVKGTGPK